jgi:hypothetical protein
LPATDFVLLGSLPALANVWAYGPLPGVELFGYFLALLAWIGLALAAILRAPVAALLRRLRKGKDAPATGSLSTSAEGLESSVEGRQ